MELHLRVGNRLDIKNIVKLHFESQVVGLLSNFSPELLEKTFYQNIFSPGKVLSLLAVERSSNRLVGVGIVRVSSFRIFTPSVSDVLKISRKLIIPALSCSSTIAQILNHLRSESFLSSREYLSDNVYVELQILLVHKDYQGDGVGTRIFTELLREQISKGTMVVRTQNPKAVSFYEKFGFATIRTFSCFGVSLWILERSVV